MTPELSSTFNQPENHLVSFQLDSQQIKSTCELLLALGIDEKPKPAHKRDEKETKTQTIVIPKGYIICPENYVCIPKDVYQAQPAVPSAVNAAPNATITNPNPSFNPIQVQNPNQALNQNIQQNNQGIGGLGGIGGINPNNPNQYPGGGFNPNQGINQGIGGISQPNGNQGTTLMWGVSIGGGWRF